MTAIFYHLISRKKGHTNWGKKVGKKEYQNKRQSL